MSRKKTAGTPHSEKVIVLMRIASLKERLLDLYTPRQADEWINAPQKLLSGQRPIDMLSTMGGYLEVDNVVDQILSGTHI